MSIKHLQTPIKAADFQDIHTGDIVYLTGTLVTARDCVHTRLVKQGRALPVDLKEKSILHAGPIMQEDATSPSGYKVVSIGPTTSMRMEKFEYEFVRETGVRLIVGKGGMGPNTVRACSEFKALHCVFPGGCAVVAASCVEQVEDVQWHDLGMPEAMWVMRVKDFGPLIVSIDTHGENLFDKNRALFNERKEPIVERLAPQIEYID